jgi:hypothetical protein
MLIKRVYEIDPLACPECGGRMKVIAFIEPPQGDVIEKILRHCGLWRLLRQWCVRIGADGSLPGRSARQQGRGKRRVAAATLLFPRPCSP